MRVATEEEWRERIWFESLQREVLDRMWMFRNTDIDKAVITWQRGKDLVIDVERERGREVLTMEMWDGAK